MTTLLKNLPFALLFAVMPLAELLSFDLLDKNGVPAVLVHMLWIPLVARFLVYVPRSLPADAQLVHLGTDGLFPFASITTPGGTAAYQVTPADAAELARSGRWVTSKPLGLDLAGWSYDVPAPPGYRPGAGIWAALLVAQALWWTFSAYALLFWNLDPHATSGNIGLPIILVALPIIAGIGLVVQIAAVVVLQAVRIPRRSTAVSLSGRILSFGETSVTLGPSSTVVFIGDTLEIRDHDGVHRLRGRGAELVVIWDALVELIATFDDTADEIHAGISAVVNARRSEAEG